MYILLAFAPFVVFAVIDRTVGATPALVAGALASAALLLRDWMSSRGAKVLEIGTFLLFAGLAAYVASTGTEWTVMGVRLRVDVGLLLIVLISMALRRPFTLQYARAQTPMELWGSPQFIRTNYIITAVWALAFAAMSAAEYAVTYVPGVPQRAAIVVIVLAVGGAIKFTSWYPDRVKARLAA